MDVRTKRILGLIGCTAILAVGIYVFNHVKNGAPKTVSTSSFKYDDTRVSQLKIIEPSQSDEDIKKIILDDYVYAKMAKDSGISVSDSEVAASVAAVGDTSNPRDKDYLTLVWHRNILRDKLTNAFKGYMRGRFVLARYDYHRVIENADPSPQLANLSTKQLADMSVIDETYAKAMADRIHSELIAKKITFDQAIQEELSDPKTGKLTTPTVDHSGVFDTADERSANYSLVNQPQILSVLQKLGVGEVSEVIKGQTVASFDMKKYADGVYLILIVDERANKITTYKSFSDMETAYKAKVQKAGITL